MPRKPPPTFEALDALDAAQRTNAELVAMDRECSEEREELIAARDQLWAEAFDGGATYDLIAERCGVSTHTVRLHVARTRGIDWAQR
jgi:DNA-directed RNA polymerase specialized sigma24 family protein